MERGTGSPIFYRRGLTGLLLGLRRDQFLVFTDATTEAVNVLYRRKNGGLGLIEPVA